MRTSLLILILMLTLFRMSGQTTDIHDNPAACDAAFTGTVDLLDPMIIHFQDQSTGQITVWQWSFGDGATTTVQNPVHTYPAGGTYFVCLTVSNSDTGSLCHDVLCVAITIHEPGTCVADYKYATDSADYFKVSFTDLSTGSINRWHWNFGDGSVSEERNPVHIFPADGRYGVCLLAYNSDSVSVCNDNKCDTLTIASQAHFNIGGHLFIGSSPINNPVSTGDTGVAYLFRLNDSHLTALDTCRFTQLGYFAFPSHLKGCYLVRALLTEGSAHYDAWFPGYYRQTLFWNEATGLILSDSSAYLSEIHLSPASGTLPGSGSVKGYVVLAGSSATSEIISDAEVILFDGQMNPILFNFSDPAGQFGFENLPFGMYYTRVEVPGYYSRLTALWLDSAVPAIDSVRLEIFNHDVTAIDELQSGDCVIGEPFPNPVSTRIYLPIHLQKETMLKFTIMTMPGVIQSSGSYYCHSGDELISISADMLHPGMYLLDIRDGTNAPVAIRKLVKY